MSIEWKFYKSMEEYRLVNNKKVLAVYVTKENAEKIGKETGAFAMFNESTACTGFLSLQKIPSWMIMLNPKGKKKKYIFESERVFDKYFELLEDTE